VVDIPQHPVAIVFHEVIVGGASRSILRILPLLEARGWSFVCWTPGAGPLQAELEARGYEISGRVRLLRYSRRSLLAAPGPFRRLASVPGYLREVRSWMRSARPALLHANTLLTIPEALAAGRRTPTVLYAHETLPAGIKGRLTAGLAAGASDVVVGISDAATAPLRRRGVPLVVVPNGVPDPGRPAPRHDGGGLVIGTLGTVSKRKGSDVFLAAVQRIRAEMPDAEFRMIGACVEGPDRRWAERLVADAGRAGVRVGERPEPYPELREWDIAVVPSRDEPFGLVAAEAMALGLPVVASRVGGLPEVVAPDAGLLVEPGDPEALARAILALARDPGRRAAYGEAGRARALDMFSLERQAVGVEHAYFTALLSASATSSCSGCACPP
jgi:glycosyltransferase involved in cell wall biosynthesis